MNELEVPVAINIRAPRYYIARTRGACRHCNRTADLFALALPPGHETLDVDETTDGAIATAATDAVTTPADAVAIAGAAVATAGDAAAADGWILVNHHALIFHIESLNAEAAARLTSVTGSFRVAQLDSGAGSAWTNHCEACGASFDDEELFCEPGEPFLPISAAGAAAIRLLAIDEPLEAVAGGYSFDPGFIHAMSRE